MSKTDWTIHFPGLRKLEPSIAKPLVETSKIVTLPAGRRIFGPGQSPESNLLLLAGTVRVQQVSETGREIVFYRVLAQIASSDIAGLAAAGLRSIIANRPDGEGADQPLFAEMETAARAHGMAARYLPVASGKVTDADAKAFADALSGLPKPVLAYCRTGTRSATL